MALKESGEMYLETILLLSRQKPSVRAIDVVEQMGFSKPSVSRALSKLREEHFILVDNNGHLALTDSGRALAEKIYERHTVLTAILTQLGVDGETAAADACKIEHVISDKTFAAMKRHLSQFEKQK